ncbi:MAG: hypothetical protein JWN56_2539 [Sphingobacteriales bacterium]|nr:hypothetical protein [Sphingobacteriales bacterium]
MRKSLLILMLVAIALTSCKKKKLIKPEQQSTPVKFITTEYAQLGTYDSTGRPNYLAGTDVVSNGLKSFVSDMLPERVNVTTTHPDFLKNADLEITSKSDVYVTFISAVTGRTNTVGFYLYKTGSSPTKPQEIEKITYIFPNARSTKSGSLLVGDKVKLGTIEAGMSIGFVLLDNGWDTSLKTVNKNVAHYCSNKELNPENDAALKYHTVLFEYPAENKFIIGFEDYNRTLATCDNDFNDVVVYATIVKK